MCIRLGEIASTIICAAPDRSIASPTTSIARISTSSAALTLLYASSGSMVRVTSSATAPSIARIWIGASSIAEQNTMAPSTSSTSGRAPALERLGGGLAQVDQIHVGGEPADVVRRTLEQQRVADPDHHLVELAADVLAAAVHRERIDAVAAAQAQAAERPADEAAFGQDQRLHRRGGLGAHPVDERHLVRSPSGREAPASRCAAPPGPPRPARHRETAGAATRRRG